MYGEDTVLTGTCLQKLVQALCLVQEVIFITSQSSSGAHPLALRRPQYILSPHGDKDVHLVCSNSKLGQLGQLGQKPGQVQLLLLL